MERIRIPVLVGLAVGAVLAFLVAPSTGLLARVPLMVLCGVLAVIWQLAVEGIGRSGSSSAPGAVGVTTPEAVATAADEVEHRPGYFEVEAELEPVAATHAPSEPYDLGDASDQQDPAELAALPDPPANWPPHAVDVPLVFQLTDDGAELPPEPMPELPPEPMPEPAFESLFEPLFQPLFEPLAAPAADADPEHDPDTSVVIDLTEPSAAERQLVSATAHGEDPWLAFAASMFGHDQRTQRPGTRRSVPGQHAGAVQAEHVVEAAEREPRAEAHATARRSRRRCTRAFIRVQNSSSRPWWSRA